MHDINPKAYQTEQRKITTKQRLLTTIINHAINDTQLPKRGSPIISLGSGKNMTEQGKSATTLAPLGFVRCKMKRLLVKFVTFCDAKLNGL